MDTLKRDINKLLKQKAIDDVVELDCFYLVPKQVFEYYKRFVANCPKKDRTNNENNA